MKHASAASLLHPGVAEIAARHPDRIAVREGERELDYATLVRRASDLAAGLHARGVRPGDRVAIHLDKSTDAVVAILGVLMAGACYVPIDVRSPARRVATILADCGVRLAIGTAARTAKAFAHLPPGASVATLVALDVAEPQPASGAGTGPGIELVPWPAASARGVAPPAIEVDPETPAYILYTSGSTGTPKGVVLSHRAAMAFVAWASATFPVGPDDRVISQAPFHFDLSVFDLFVTLRAGATLVLPPAGITISPSGYVRFLHDEGITVFYATPAILSSLVRDGHLDRHDRWRLRTVLFAGDVMPPRTLGDLMRAIPAARFANLYGPTETNVCTWHEIATAPVDDTPIPIGRACAGLELRIDGESGGESGGEESGEAASGELWVAGPSLMTGYWNRPQDSAARLVADRGVPARTWYRTGDRVDRDATGLLHFRGRIDSMVKIRGHRVEPEEVEHVLRKHPAVREAVVVPVAGPSGETSLAAVVSTYDDPPGPRDLQRLCAEHLPEPMIPTAFTFTGQLPMTSTGKVDRKRVQSDLGRETTP